MGTRVFTVGDILKVTPVTGTTALIGEALETRTGSGWAYFSIRTSDGKVWEFNLNCDEVQVLYRPGAPKPKSNSIWIVQSVIPYNPPPTPQPIYGWSTTREGAQERCDLLNAQRAGSQYFVPLEVFQMGI